MPHIPRELMVLCLALAPVMASAQERRSEASWKTLRETMEAAERTGERPKVGEPPCLPVDPNRVHATRRLTLYQDAADKVLEVYVAGGVATIIRLPSALAAGGTGIAPGGRRRFNLLMGGDQILITPTRQLAKGERFPMTVALADGTVIPLSLTRAANGGRPDGELWLDREQANPEELRNRLASMEAKARGFEAGLHQALKQQESEDFELAGLMAKQSRFTAFQKTREREFMASADRQVRLKTYAPRPDVGGTASRVVAVFEVTNNGQEPLDLSSGRALRKGGDDVPFALRAQPTVIPPGGEGRIAVVLDRASFESGGTITLRFSDAPQIAGIQLSADLSLEDFTTRTKSSPWWWPF